MWGEKKAQVVAEDDKFTFLGKGTSFKGIVSFDGTVRIDGRVEGEVHTGGAVIVGESAVIKGIISAGSVVISGRVKGTAGPCLFSRFNTVRYFSRWKLLSILMYFCNALSALARN